MLRSFGAVVLLLAAGFQPLVARERVPFPVSAAPGEIVVSQRERKLYLVLGDGTALRYPVAVGKSGKQWAGRTYVDAMHHRVAWMPPASVRRDRPGLPAVIPADDPANPMGARVISMPGEYAIHGTSRAMRGSIGAAASYGCIRMLDEDIIDLFQRVRVGTPVTVLR